MLDLKNTDDGTLVQRLIGLARSARECQVEMLQYLSEIDERRAVLELGYSGMWDFCRRALKFSESCSTRRVSVARAARVYPRLLEMLGDGRLTLCTAADLVGILSEENQEEMFEKAAGKSRREVQALGVAAGAKSVIRDVIRRVPEKARGIGLGLLPEGGEKVAAEKGHAPAAAKREAMLHRVAFTADDRVVKKLERLQELLGGASLAEVCDRAAEVLLEKVDPVRRDAKRAVKRASAGKKPAGSVRSTSEPRRPSQAIADRVFVEAKLRCAFVSEQGVRCAETRYLSIDHVVPFAKGGASRDRGNLRCLCVAHNLAAGRKEFGDVHRERAAKIRARVASEFLCP